MKRSRILSGLLILTLLSTCIIGGTFAKYVTKAEGADSARVAKWGVEICVTGSDFAKKYATTDTTKYDGTYSVVSVDEAFVVAPGTNSTDAGADVKFGITGKPEVATKIDVVLSNVKDICLPKGTYTDYTLVTGYDEELKPTYETFELAHDYYPVVWTLKEGDATLASGKLAEIKDFLDTYNSTVSMSSYSPNVDLSKSFDLTWAWEFSVNDKADTYLGNVAAGIVTDAKAITEVSYNIAVTATQVD